MQYFLCDINKPLCDAWEIAFKDIENVTVVHGSIFDLKANAIVSPANSFGFMDGGLDYLISEHLGWDVQDRLKSMIRDTYEGELLVGQTALVQTKHKDTAWVISAPTMRVPMILGANSINVFLATKAVFLLGKCLDKRNEFMHDKIESIAIPGMGTGVGKVPVEICARQMRQAYSHVQSEYFPKSWHDAQTIHQMIIDPNQRTRDLQK